MYHMKNIVRHDEEITLPKCMYHIKNPNESLKDDIDQININISNQVKKFLKAPNSKMAELEQRQEQLIKKLDILYDRIKTISSYCNSSSKTSDVKSRGAAKATIPNPEEVVLTCSPDNLPYYLNKILKDSSISVNICWHIHSTVPNEKVARINGFAKSLKTNNSSKINLRLIFKSVSAFTESELKLSSLSAPILGTVNILRYLSLAYPQTMPYDSADFRVDSLLDICHQLERTPDKAKEALFKQLFAGCKSWIHDNTFTIVDLAAYNIVKQSKNIIKFVPKAWYDICEKEFLIIYKM